MSVETLRVAIIGSGGSDPPPGYNGPAILVDDGGARLLLDCGEGCVQQLRRLGYQPCDIDAVYVTHAHIDHWSGLFPLMVARVAEGCRSITIYAHREVAEGLSMLHEIAPSKIRVELIEVDAGFRVGKIESRLVKVSHTVPAYAIGVYLEGVLRLVYTGDTALTDEMLEGLKSIGQPQLLIAEATLPTGREDVARETGHMTVTQALELREKLGAKLLIPVHLTPISLRQLLGYRRLPPGVIVPVDGISITV